MVRVAVPERGGTGYGSGALIARDSKHAWLLTNWHVVRGATGMPTVTYSNGQRFAANIIKVSVTEDLALLATLRPNVEPLKVASHAAQQNETATLHGYGPLGSYRAIDARVRGYKTLRQPDHPGTWMAISAESRPGDSGGPVVNGRNELIGVLWGSNYGETLAAHTTQIRRFVWPDRCQPLRPRQPTRPIVQPLRPVAPQRDPRIDVLVARLDALQKQVASINCEPGPAGKDGRDGKDGAPGKDGLAGKDGTNGDPATTPVSSHHYVVVADPKAGGWPRLSGEISHAREAFHAIRVSGLPSFPVGVIPQLVEYRAGDPVRVIKGSREVSAALARIAKGEQP